MSYEWGAWQAERANLADAMTALNQANANIRYLNGIVAQQQKQIAKLEEEWAVQAAHAGGYEAWVTAFATQYPGSSLQAASGKLFRDGDRKSNGRIIYEAAFDGVLRKFGIANPASRRAN